MKRRSFLAFLGATAAAPAALMTALEPVKIDYTLQLALSMMETKEMAAAQVLCRAFAAGTAEGWIT